MLPQRRLQIQPHDLRVTRGGFGAPVARNDHIQPTIKVLRNSLLLWCDIQTCGQITMECFEFVGDLLTGLATNNFAAALAVHESQIDRCTPLAVALALVNAALAVSPSLCHDSPPCRLLSMRFGACVSLHTPFNPATVAVW